MNPCRNKNVPVNHRDFWYATYTLYSVSEKTENEEKMSDNASASSGSDQGPSSRQHTMVSFLKPVLKQIIMAGKSMQLLKNLQCMESTTCQATTRGNPLVMEQLLQSSRLPFWDMTLFCSLKVIKAFYFHGTDHHDQIDRSCCSDWKKIVLVGNIYHGVWKAVIIRSTCILLILDALGLVL